MVTLVLFLVDTIHTKPKSFTVFVNLVQLSFAYTTPSDKVEEHKLTNKNIRLEQLDINHTFLNDQDLIGTISQFKSLVELKLGGCENLTTRSLSFLPRGTVSVKKKSVRLTKFDRI